MVLTGNAAATPSEFHQITGLPKALTDTNQDEAIWTKPQVFSLNNLQVGCQDIAKDTIILFLDDAHLCNKSIQSYMFQLMTYRSIHGHRLPNNVVIVMAGNRSNDKAGFQQIMAPVSNRIYFLDVDCDVDDWTENFALSHGVRTDIITFLQNNHIYFQSSPMESTAWASPRSWTHASHMMDMFEDMYDRVDVNTMTRIMSGHVGMEYATEFVKYKQLMMKWEAHLILAGTKAIPVVNGKMEAYTLMSACIGELMKHFRRNEFEVNDTIDKMIGIFRVILENLAKSSREVIPLGLKILIMGEKEKEKLNKESQAIIVKKLLTNQSLIDMLSEIVS